MKLYNSIGPNPKVVRMFMAEKGIKLPTTADILLFAFIDFFARAGQPLNPDLPNIGAWHERMKARPSAAA